MSAVPKVLHFELSDIKSSTLALNLGLASAGSSSLASQPMACIKLRNPSIPKSTKGWLLVDDLSIPRFWATVWADVLKANMGLTTRGLHLYAIERFYQATDRQFGSGALDRMLSELDMPSLESALSSFLASLRK